ncbi:histidinol-phosphate transaminase [Pontivivens insulae]|uniref:Histidinol-phosphate aminotransferase n=1 Tax=Pontivivens insulae TaxID=1639689 RepID=A0A2R8AES5_9RHOB|nr:histidinol-phosphate transaminase [Pontivivens insulae]RED11997.1 histidinol-phosphate aminotransferase [Pontivivens insulae]SPF30753.1 Histidinol-phosphate aminotransferase [Pontivivens insulae]
MTAPQPQPGILDVTPYVGGDGGHGTGANRPIKLSSNENPLGPSPNAVEAYKEVAGDLATYPDGGQTALRRAIADIYKLDADRIVCGAGSDEILSLICQAYAGPGTELIHTEHGFAMYSIYGRIAGATPVVVPEDERKTDIDAILGAVTERTRLVFLANPNNPTGTLIAQSEIDRLARSLPPHVVLVLDGAYAEFVREPGYDPGIALVDGARNVIMTRTFSKVYGLGSLRVGWGYASAEIIDVLNRVRGPFNVASPALAAAEAAVRDVEYTEHCVIQNEIWREWLARELSRAGLPSDPAHGNFLCVRFADQATANAADMALKAKGLIVRDVSGYNLPGCLRITIGDESATRAVARTLTQFMAER